MALKRRDSLHDLIIDWFQFTVHTYSIEEVVRLLFGTTLDQCTHTMQGLNGYTETYTFGRKMHVMLNRTREDMGINVMFSGSACREFESMFDFKDLIIKLSGLKQEYLNINRIDIAIDYFGKDFSVKTIEKKVEKEQLTSRFKTVSVLYERKINGERIGEQVTFGRKISDLHVVFYNKLKERQEMGYQFEKDIKNWLRCEMRFRHDNANALYKLLVKDYESIGKYAKGVLRRYLSFKIGVYNGDKSHKCRGEECRWWINFTDNASRLRLEKRSLSSSIVKKRDYTEQRLSKILALLHIADNKFLGKCVAVGVDKLTDDDWLMLNSYFLRNNMPFMTRDELNRIISKYKESKNIKIQQEETLAQLKMF